MAEAIWTSYIDNVGELRRFLEPFADDCPVRGDLKFCFLLNLLTGSALLATTEQSVSDDHLVYPSSSDEGQA